jgi:hypothetical protein
VPAITREVLEGYLHCRYLAHLRLTGLEAPRTDYEEMVFQANLEQKLTAFSKLYSRDAENGIVTGVNLTRAELRKGASFILDAELQHDAFRVRLRGIPMGVIANQIGHADTRMTERHYAHLAPSYIADAIREGFPIMGIVQVSNIAAISPRKQ